MSISPTTVPPLIGSIDGIDEKYLQSNGPLEINIFDFDGTLFRSPAPQRLHWDRVAIDRLYTKPPEGLGWFQSEITLQPPYVPAKPDRQWFNDYVAQQARSSNSHASCITILMTGRMEYLQERVKQIATSQGLKFDHFFFKEEGTTSSTVENKLRQIELLLQQYKTVRVVNIWDDRKITSFVEWLQKRVEMNRLCRFSVVKVEDGDGALVVDQEINLVRELINAYNQRHSLHLSPTQMQLHSRVTYTVLWLNEDSRAQLLAQISELTQFPPTWARQGRYATLRRGIAPDNVLARVGGIGAWVNFQVSEIRVDPTTKVVARVYGVPFPNSIAQITVAHVRASLRDQRDDDTLPWQALDHPIRLRGVVQFLYYNDIRGGKIQHKVDMPLSQAIVDHFFQKEGDLFNRVIAQSRAVFNLLPQDIVNDDGQRILSIAGEETDVNDAIKLLNEAINLI